MGPEVAMRAFLGSVLSVIAVGVLLIAYGLLSPRAAAAPWGQAADSYQSPYANPYQTARPVPVSDIVSLGQPAYDPYTGARTAVTYPVSARTEAGGAIRTVQTSAPVRRTAAQVEASSGRNWKKTALVIGGTSAAGAGIGAIFGGGKGALIGAALGGGVSSLYEATKR
jgi:hypothetical protein